MRISLTCLSRLSLLALMSAPLLCAAQQLEEYGQFNPKSIEKRTSPFLSPLSRSAPISAPSVVTQVQQKSVKDTVSEFLVPIAYWEGSQNRVFIADQFYEVGDIIKLEVLENPELYQKSVIEVVVLDVGAEQVGFQETIGSEHYPVTYDLSPDLESRRFRGGPVRILHVGKDDNLVSDLLSEPAPDGDSAPDGPLAPSEPDSAPEETPPARQGGLDDLLDAL